MIAKLFAMILEQTIASRAEKQGVKAKGQAGFRKDFRTTDNIFILRLLIDNQRSHYRRETLASCIVVLSISRKLSILYLILYCGRCWKSLVSVVESWTSSSFFTHTTAQQYGHRKACPPSSDA